jgi:NADH-ubiquinone oxidoreductase chain 5
MIIAVFGSLDFDVVFSLAPSINPTLITIICILLFIGAGAKSAVLGLHS